MVYKKEYKFFFRRLVCISMDNSATVTMKRKQSSSYRCYEGYRFHDTEILMLFSSYSSRHFKTTRTFLRRVINCTVYATASKPIEPHQERFQPVSIHEMPCRRLPRIIGLLFFKEMLRVASTEIVKCNILFKYTFFIHLIHNTSWSKFWQVTVWYLTAFHWLSITKLI